MSRQLGAAAQVLEQFDLIARVTKSTHCANMIKGDQIFVVDLKGRLDPVRTNAPMCLGILAKLQPALLVVQDRLSEGLFPISSSFRNFDCFDTGIDYGGTGKVYVELELVNRATREKLDAVGYSQLVDATNGD